MNKIMITPIKLQTTTKGLMITKRGYLTAMKNPRIGEKVGKLLNHFGRANRMKINYALLRNMNETHISFEAIKRSSKKGETSTDKALVSKKTNKRRNSVVRGFKRNYQETLS